MLHGRKDYNKRIQDSAHLIPEDEPVFLLRAQDLLSYEILEEYLIRLKTYPKADPAIVEAIEKHMKRFFEWRTAKQHGRDVKFPDMKTEDIV